jgi:hypothetical protein
MALNPSANRALNAVGNVDVNMVGCALYVNSNHSQAARTTGGADVTADAVYAVGDYSGTGFSPTPITGAARQIDPFADMTMPSTTSSCDHTNRMVHGTETLSPGTYCNGLTFNAQARATLLAGTYVINGGGISVSAGARITGNGVTIYNTESSGKTYDAITVNGGADLTLSAPTTGTYKGMLFIQDPSVTSTKTNKFNGNASVSLIGVLYFPTTPVEFAGTFDATANNLMMVADTVEFKGDVNFAVLNDTYLPPALSFARMVD